MNAADSQRHRVGFTEEDAARLAESNPDELFRLAEGSQLAAHELFYVAEFLGYVASSEALKALVDLSTHESPLVREGAARGLAAIASRLASTRALDRAKAILRSLAESEEHPSVRRAAADGLADL